MDSERDRGRDREGWREIDLEREIAIYRGGDSRRDGGRYV